MEKIAKNTEIKEVKIKKLDKNCDLFLGNGITIEILKDTPFASDYSCQSIVERAISSSYQKDFFENKTPLMRIGISNIKSFYKPNFHLKNKGFDLWNETILAKRIKLIKNYDNQEFINYFINEIKLSINNKYNVNYIPFEYTLDFNKLSKDFIENLIFITKKLYETILTLVNVSENKKMNVNILEKNYDFYSFESWFIYLDQNIEMISNYLKLNNPKIKLKSKQEKKKFLEVYDHLNTNFWFKNLFKNIIVSSIYNYKNGKLISLDLKPEEKAYLNKILNSARKVFTLNYDNFSEKISSRNDIIHLHGRLDYYYDYESLEKKEINLKVLREDFLNATNEIFMACDACYKHYEMRYSDIERSLSFILDMPDSTENYENVVKDRWCEYINKKQNKKVIIIGVNLKNDNQYLKDLADMYDEIYIGYFSEEEKGQFTYFLDKEEEEVNYEFFKKCFYFDVQKLYKLYK